MIKFKDSDMQALLGKVLRAGTIISISIVFLGGVLYLYRHGHTIADYATFKGVPAFIQDGTDIMHAIVALKGQAIIQAGIILLILTPVFRVIMSAVGFVLEKDYMYAGISMLVLFIILMSTLNGHAG